MCGDEPPNGEAAFSLHSIGYSDHNVPSSPGVGATFTYAEAVTFTGLQIEQHSNGCKTVAATVDGIRKAEGNGSNSDPYFGCE